jgi:hypothetical protein
MVFSHPCSCIVPYVQIAVIETRCNSNYDLDIGIVKIALVVPCRRRSCHFEQTQHLRFKMAHDGNDETGIEKRRYRPQIHILGSSQSTVTRLSTHIMY